MHGDKRWERKDTHLEDAGGIEIFSKFTKLGLMYNTLVNPNMWGG